MGTGNAVLLWVGAGASALLLFILVCLALFVVVRAGVLSALRTHAREERRRVRTGTIDVLPRADLIPRTELVSRPAAAAGMPANTPATAGPAVL